MSSDGEGEKILGAVGLTAQPVVWFSLYYVATTGAGLPAGPFGLLGIWNTALVDNQASKCK